MLMSFLTVAISQVERGLPPWLLVGARGPTAAALLNVASFLLYGLVLLRLPFLSSPAPEARAPSREGWLQRFLHGVEFVRRKQPLPTALALGFA